ncbi:NUDIX domain-containing protein [Streptomyces sp. NPDC058657]|uniref:NUDIX domain-containing protein n=1 Tax=unclassified Streptomyces TaxID=2593676 RepID=UPI00366A1DFB
MTYTEKLLAIRYAADVVAITHDGRVALIERGWDPFAGHHALPGGHVDDGETSRQAAARELFEEIGVQIDPDGLQQIGVFDDPNRDPRGRYVAVAYLAHVSNNTVLTAGDDARTADWWPLDSLPPLAFDHADIIRAATRLTS